MTILPNFVLFVSFVVKTNLSFLARFRLDTIAPPRR